MKRNGLMKNGYHSRIRSAYSAATDTIVVHNTHVYVVIQYYQYIYIQVDIAVGIVFNLSDKRKSKEILETSRKICHANSIIVTHPI